MHMNTMGYILQAKGDIWETDRYIWETDTYSKERHLDTHEGQINIQYMGTDGNIEAQREHECPEGN